MVIGVVMATPLKVVAGAVKVILPSVDALSKVIVGAAMRSGAESSA